jgi:hypothetical protein
MTISKTIVFMLLFIPAALRYGIGTDYFSYVRIFGLSKYSFNDLHVEYSYYILNRFFAIRNYDVQWVFAIMAFLTLFFLFLATPRKTFFLILPFYFCLFYGESYNIVRQALVITIGYYAIQLYQQKKLIKSLAVLGFATFFHKSAFFYIPIILFSFLRITKKCAVISFLLLLVFGFVADEFIESVFNQMNAYNIMYASYAYSRFNAKVEVTTGIGLILRYIMYAIVLVGVSNEKTRETSNMFMFFLTLIFFDILGSTISIFGRVSRGFSIAWFPALQNLNVLHAKYRKIILIIIYLYGILILMDSLITGASEITPYRTIFSK